MAEHAIVPRATRAVDDQHSGSGAIGERLLGDEFFGEMVIEVGKNHAASIIAHNAAWHDRAQRQCGRNGTPSRCVPRAVRLGSSRTTQRGTIAHNGSVARTAHHQGAYHALCDWDHRAQERRDDSVNVPPRRTRLRGSQRRWLRDGRKESYDCCQAQQFVCRAQRDEPPRPAGR